MRPSYCLGFSARRCCASAISASRSPVIVAPVGQASEQAVGLPRNLALVAHVALPDLRQRLAPLIHRHLERARQHAVAAAHAAIFLVNHRTKRGLLESAHRANRRAGRLDAVHAHATRELLVEGNHRRHLALRQSLLGRNGRVVVQPPLLRTGFFARPASNAERAVIKDCL